MSDLKPCPFCGGEATHDTNGSEIWVICKKCGARCAGSFFSGKKGVQVVNERWNKRAPSAQPEIIRCNVCRYWHQTTGEMKGFGLGDCDYLEKKLVTCNGYCYWAERKEDE